jgi:hypothetical protein
MPLPLYTMEEIWACRPLGQTQLITDWTSKAVYHTLKLLDLPARLPTRRSYRGGRLAGLRQRFRLDSCCGDWTSVSPPLFSKDKRINHGHGSSHQPSLPQLGLLNARSVSKRKDLIADLIVSLKIDFLALTETWLNMTHGNHILKSACPAGFTAVHLPRPQSVSKKGGGGLGLIYSDAFTVNRMQQPSNLNLTSFELLDLMISSSTKHCRLLVIYRPPERPRQQSFSVFISEFEQLLCSLADIKEDLVIVGDFNIHVEAVDNCKARLFNQLVESLGWTQLVDGRTHTAAHTLDLVLTRTGSPFVVNVQVGDLVSDHHLITCSIGLGRPQRKKMTVSCRDYRSIDLNDLVDDLLQLPLILDPVLDTDDCLASLNGLVDQYGDIRQVIENHAKLHVKEVTIRDPAPWINKRILDARRALRKGERLWRCSGYLEVHLESYKTLASDYSEIIKTEKGQYYCSIVADCGGDQRKLYRLVDSWLGREKACVLPEEKSATDLANRFAAFFNDKVEKIKTTLLAERERIDPKWVLGADRFLDKWSEADCFNDFRMVGCDEVRKFIMNSPTKSCVIDPIPTSLLKKVSDYLTPSITSIVNLSLYSGVFPHQFKNDLITPILKKPKLDGEILENYRPITNLPFVSKLIERVASSQLNEHLALYDLLSPSQSAYRAGDSTETALLALQNDLLLAASRGDGCVVLLLDLSAAFDTVDHGILIDRLSSHCGLGGTALSWFASYLSGRTQTVVIDGAFSHPVDVIYGVPQGSVIGPKLYTIYVNCLRKVAAVHGVKIHQYSDDTTVYLEFRFPPGIPDQMDALRILSCCAGDLADWFAFNWVRLNPDKSDFLYFAPFDLACLLPLFPLRMKNQVLSPSNSAKLL